MEKLYCYVDETGQDTQGKFFLIAVVIVIAKQRESVENRLTILEQSSGKKRLKWKQTSTPRKLAYLEGVLQIDDLQKRIFYASYYDTKSYLSLLAQTISRAIEVFATVDYNATIYIDGLRFQEVKKVAAGLRDQGIKRRKVKGLRDESSALIRLADAMAGFFRESEEGKPYTANLLPMFHRTHSQKLK